VVLVPERQREELADRLAKVLASSAPAYLLTKEIHASRSAAADLGHALACGYARGSGTGLAVAGALGACLARARQRRRPVRRDVT
jgi:hypothetical protein